MNDNQVYYAEIGRGSWGGGFDFRIKDKVAYRKASIGFVNRLLVFALRLVIKLLGKPEIRSEITFDKKVGPAGTGRNTYQLMKWGIPLCVFNDVYKLDADGRHVVVITDLRYGPIPGILTDHVEYKASIFEGGFRSEYQGLRLLGSMWVANYKVASDRNHVEGLLVSEWGEATEWMFRQSA